MKRDDLGDDDRRAGKHGCRGQPGDGPTDDEDDGGRRCSTQGGANLKDEDRKHGDDLGAIELINATPQQLCRATAEEVASGIPSDVVEGVKMIGDDGNGGGDDGPVLIKPLVTLTDLGGRGRGSWCALLGRPRTSLTKPTRRA